MPKKKSTKKVVNLENLTDMELVEVFKGGNVSAFELLVTRHQSKVYNLAIKLTKNPDDAEEVLQDVWSTIFRKIDMFKGQSAFTSWMYRICVNASFMKLRKNNQHAAIHLEDLSRTLKQMYMNREASFANQSDYFTLSREVKFALNQAVTTLPEQYKSVFVLRDVDGLSNEEVAKILGISLAAIKSRLHRSRLMLRENLMVFWKDYKGMIKPEKIAANI